MAVLNKVVKDNFTSPIKGETPFPVYSIEYNKAVDQINTNTSAIAANTASLAAIAALNTTTGGTTSVGSIQKTLVNITSANILAMNGAPVTVIPAKGAGTTIALRKCVAIFDSTATTYANGGVIYLSYNNTTPITNNLAATFVTAGDKVYALNPLAAAGGNNMLVNTPLTITNDTAAFITGTGVIRLLVEYEVITTGL